MLSYDENFTPMPSPEDVNPDFIKTKREKEKNINHPYHYNQGGVECIDAIQAATVNLSGEEAFCIGNAIKYLWRYKDKNGVEDLDKAIWYINRAKQSLGKNK